MQNPLVIVDLAKAVEVLLLLLPGHDGAAAVDSTGSSNLAILRAMGLPSTIAVVMSQQQQQQQHNAADQDMLGVEDDGDGDDAQAGSNHGVHKLTSAALKQRSAAKKRVERVLQQHLPGDVKLLTGDTHQA